MNEIRKLKINRKKKIYDILDTNPKNQMGTATKKSQLFNYKNVIKLHNIRLTPLTTL